MTKYYCEVCKNMRNVEIPQCIIDRRSDISYNGLIVFSDVHKCKDAILGVNNLRIDENYDVRAFEPQELPPVRPIPKFSIPSTTSPVVVVKKYKELLVTNITDKIDFKIVITDDWLFTKMNFGNIDTENDIPINMIQSDLGGIMLQYYNSDIIYTPNLEKWLYLFVNSLENLPPSKFGFVIETLRYMIDFHHNPPSNFDKKLILTILASHEVYFRVVDNPQRYDYIATHLSAKFNKIDYTFLMKLMAHLELHPTSPLLDYIKVYDYDLEYLIYLFLVLEREGLIIVDRPGIINA